MKFPRLENPYFLDTRKYNISGYSNNSQYEKFDVVHISGGIFMARQEVSGITPPIGTGSYSSSEFNYWFPMINYLSSGDVDYDYPVTDFADGWTPFRDSSFELNQQINTLEYGDGYQSNAANSLTHQKLNIKVLFSNITDKETRSLLIFNDIYGSVGRFKYTLPFPYETGIFCRMSNLNHTYQGYNSHDVSFDLVQSYNFIKEISEPAATYYDASENVVQQSFDNPGDVSEQLTITINQSSSNSSENLLEMSLILPVAMTNAKLHLRYSDESAWTGPYNITAMPPFTPPTLTFNSNKTGFQMRLSDDSETSFSSWTSVISYPEKP